MCRFRLVFQTSSLDRRRPPQPGSHTRVNVTGNNPMPDSSPSPGASQGIVHGICSVILAAPCPVFFPLTPCFQRRCRPGRPPIAAGPGGWAWARWGGLHRGGARAGGRTHVRGQQGARGARGTRSLPDAAAPKLHSGSTAVTDHSLLGCP